MDEVTLYVDVENLQEIAKQALISAIEHWPTGLPTASRLRLYVEADQTELWQIWANHHIAAIDIAVKGVQHYTLSGSKNSADILLALDAIVDMLKGRTKYVAIMSDDSDFATLFSIIKREVGLAGDSKVPFKWFMTDRPDTRSSVLRGFFPTEYIQLVACSTKTHDSAEDNPDDSPIEKASGENDEIARFIIQTIPIGQFKSGDCKKLIAKNFPKNPMGKLDSANFGIQFSKSIWPILEGYGVQLPNPKRKPRKYEMTEEAKQKAL